MIDEERQVTRQRVMTLLEHELEGTLDDSGRRWLDAHRGEFPECEAVLRAVEGEGVLWDELGELPGVRPPAELGVRSQIEAHLAGEPVEALPLENRPRAGLMVASLFLVGLFLAALGLRSDLSEQPWWETLAPGLLLVGGFSAALVSFDHLRRQGYRTLSLGVMAAAPLLLVLLAFTLEPMPQSHVAHSFVGSAVGCGTVGLILGLFVLVPAVVLARRGMAGPSLLGALVLGMTAASAGVGALHLRCSIVDPAHVLVGHGVLFLLLPVAAVLLRRVRRLA